VQQQPKETPPGGEPVSHSHLSRTHEEILEYWTVQRMTAAKPRELRLPEGGPRLKQRDADSPAPGSQAAP
jgi:hypothetical protein